MRSQLLQWQWSNYETNHQDRRNLALHIVTAPLFMSGTVLLLGAPFTAWWLALVGLVLMVAVVALQGRGHAIEKAAPIPFEGPTDVISRIFVEQWVTFPRFVLSGGWAKAWKAAARG